MKIVYCLFDLGSRILKASVSLQVMDKIRLEKNMIFKSLMPSEVGEVFFNAVFITPDTNIRAQEHGSMKLVITLHLHSLTSV